MSSVTDETLSEYCSARGVDLDVLKSGEKMLLRAIFELRPDLLWLHQEDHVEAVSAHVIGNPSEKISENLVRDYLNSRMGLFEASNLKDSEDANVQRIAACLENEFLFFHQSVQAMMATRMHWLYKTGRLVQDGAQS